MSAADQVQVQVQIKELQDRVAELEKQQRGIGGNAYAGPRWDHPAALLDAAHDNMHLGSSTEVG